MPKRWSNSHTHSEDEISNENLKKVTEKFKLKLNKMIRQPKMKYYTKKKIQLKTNGKY